MKTGRGAMSIRNDLVMGSGTLDVQEGTVSGNGTIAADVINEGGTISPGNHSLLGAGSVPEPASFLLLLTALGLVLMCQRIQR